MTNHIPIFCKKKLFKNSIILSTNFEIVPYLVVKDQVAAFASLLSISKISNYKLKCIIFYGYKQTLLLVISLLLLFVAYY